MNDFLFVPSAKTIAERRDAAEKEKLYRAAERQKMLATLKSPRHEAKDRIRLWEQLFGIHLPREADHKLVGVIATQTALSEGDVQLEQSRRLSASEPKAETGSHPI